CDGSNLEDRIKKVGFRVLFTDLPKLHGGRNKPEHTTTSTAAASAATSTRYTRKYDDIVYTSKYTKDEDRSYTKYYRNTRIQETKTRDYVRTTPTPAYNSNDFWRSNYLQREEEEIIARHHVFKGSKKIGKGTAKGLNKVRKAIGLKNMKRMGKGIKKFWHKAF
ncbi:hypothetical protein CONCODRAFT_3175, partial [Conidiobolus coronatus NRRL 28638]